MAGAIVVRELLTFLGVKADDKEIKRMDTSIQGAVLSMGVLTGAVASAVGSLFGMTVATANQGDAAAKAAQRVGVTAEEFQELTFAAEKSGASLEQVEAFLRDLAKTSDEASRNGGDIAKQYGRIGVQIRDTNGQIKPQIQLLEEVSDGLRTLKTEQERSSVAQRLGGEAAARILPLLNQGAEGIRKLRKEAHLYGAVLSEEATKASEDFNDRLLEARSLVTGLRNRLGAALLPTLTNLIERLRDWVLQNRVLIDQRIDRAVISITNTINTLDEAFQRVDKSVQEGPGGWGVIFEQVGKVILTAGLIKGFTSLITLGRALKGVLLVTGAAGGVALSPFALWGAALVALLIALDDFIVFLRGGNSAIGSFLAKFGEGNATLEKFWALFMAIGELIQAVGGVFGPMLTGLAEAIGLFSWWEAILIGLDVVAFKVIIRIQKLIDGTTDAVQLLTLAFKDLNAFGAVLFARFGRVAEGFSSLWKGVQKDAEETIIREQLKGDKGNVGIAPANALAGAVGSAVAGAFASELTLQARRFESRAGGLGAFNREGDNITINTPTSLGEVIPILEQRSLDRQRSDLQQAMAAAGGGAR